MQASACDPHWKRTLGVLTVVVGSFAFQETGILPVLPTIQKQLAAASTTSSALLLSGFLIVAAVAAPLLGKLGDAHGKQRMILVALGIYFVGAVGAGTAPGFLPLVLFRALQGAGGAVFSLSFAVMRDEAPSKLSVAIGVVVGGFGVGASLGFATSGLITAMLSWRYIFFAEAVLMAISVPLVAKWVPRSPQNSDVRMDYRGVGLLGAAVAALILGLAAMLMMGWKVVWVFALSALLFALWTWRERRARQPLLDITVLTNRKGPSEQPSADDMISREFAERVAWRRAGWLPGQAARRGLRALWISPSLSNQTVGPVLSAHQPAARWLDRQPACRRQRTLSGEQTGRVPSVLGCSEGPKVLLPITGSGLAGYAAFSLFFLVPRYVQIPAHAPAHVATHLDYGFHAGLIATGLYLLPAGAGVLCAGPFGGVLACFIHRNSSRAGSRPWQAW